MCVAFRFCVVGVLACQLGWVSIAVMFCFVFCFSGVLACLGLQYCVTAVTPVSRFNSH